MKRALIAAVLLWPFLSSCSVVSLKFIRIAQFTECPANPTLTLGAPGSFDAGSVRDNVLWYGRGKIWTLYTAAAVAIPPYHPTIGIAYSTDGCTWTKGGQVIVPNQAVIACAGGVFSPAAYYSDSDDVLTVAVSCVASPSEWYTGPIAIAELQAPPRSSWTSPASYVWQNGGKPVLTKTQAWEGKQGVYAPSIMATGGKYYMYFSSSTPSATYQVGIAVSSTPLGPWTKSSHNPITSRTAICEEPSPIALADGEILIFCDAIGTAEHGMNVYSLAKSSSPLTGEWIYGGTFRFADNAPWSLGEIGSQSAVALPDGRMLLAYNGKPGGTQADDREIGFAFFQIQGAH